MAPVVVAISKNIPARRFVIFSLTYVAAAPLDVAMTETMEAPMASLISM